MNENLTPAQEAAITHKERSITLSAAAGSGKTFVLTNRIIEKLMKDKVDVSSLLVVTFTVDAAAEIKSRISAELKKKLEDDPTNTDLRLQSIKVQKADICTIDSFYQKLLRRNFEKTDVSPDFQIIDGISYNLLTQRIATETIEEISAIDKFRPLFINIPAYDTQFENLLIKGYSYFTLKPFPKDFYNRISSLYDVPMYESIWFKSVINNLYSYLITVKEKYDSFIASLIDYDEINDALKGFYLDDYALIDGCIEDISNKNFSSLKSKLESFVLKRFSRPAVLKECQKADEYSELRNELKEKLLANSNFYEYVLLSEESYKTNTSKLKKVLELIYDAVEIFSLKLNSELNKLNKLYFAQIQKKCFELLVKDYDFENDKVTPTDTALEISKQYTEIFIDEYQDTDSVQDIIFRAISKDENNIFAVGDEKQCIYSFRGAEPDVFQKRMRAETNENIYLSENFRSRTEIIEFVNLIFNNSMRPDTGFSDYENVDRLAFGSKDYKEGKGLSKCVLINVDESDSENNQTDDLMDEDDKTANVKEAKYVAKEIKSLIENKVTVFDKSIKKMREIKLSDIVIILRTNKHKATFAKILSASGISVFNDNGAEFFKKYEISVIISLLKVIDNSKDDLATASVMRSPLFCFTDRELASLIIESGAKSICEAVNKSYGKNAKVTEFLDKIARYRVIASSVQVYTLLNYIYTDLNAEALFLATENGREKVNNLINLIYTAEAFEKNNVGGIYSFIECVNEQLSSENSEKEKKPVTDGDFVKIISIHGSKGLEYPVCFICDLFKKFNRNDATMPIKLDNNYGLCMKIIGDNGIKYETLQNSVYGMIVDSKNAKEEQRLLYVAMTRARERLYLVGATKKLNKVLKKAAALTENSEKTTAWNINSAKCYTDWILPMVMRYENSNTVRKAIELPQTANKCKSDYVFELFNCDKNIIKQQSSEISTVNIGEIVDKISNYCKTEEKLPILPEKISVSELKALENGKISSNYAFSAKPTFKTTKIDARDKGNAIHKFLRYCDWKKLAGKGNDELSAEGQLLIGNNVFSKSEASALDYTAIHNFFNNSITKSILNAGKVFHEKKFTLNFKASDIISTDCNDTVTVQGIIDMFVLCENGIYLIDFKTDKLKEDSHGDELIEKYRIQLEIYQKAIERIYEKQVIKKYIYSFSLNKYLEL